MSQALLKTDGLTKEFDSVVAIDDVTLSFSQDTLHAIIGPNGAGKTTFFNLLTGALKPTEGTIRFKDDEITSLSPEKIAQKSLIRSYQTTTVFENLSVRENVRISIQARHSKYNFWTDVDSFPQLAEEAKAILRRIGLLEKSEEIAGNLSHGEQRMLELAIVLGADPDLLLLDEPTSGMSSEETAGMIDIIQDISEDITIIIIEHKMSVVMEVADRIMVLHNGGIIANDIPAKVQDDETVQQVYLQGGSR